MAKVNVTITAKWDQKTIDQFKNQIELITQEKVKEIYEMAVTNKVQVLTGVRQSGSLINLDQKFKDSYQLLIGSVVEFNALTLNAWHEIPNGSRVSISINNSNKIVAVNIITKEKLVIEKLAKPDGYKNGFWIDTNTQTILNAGERILNKGDNFNLLLAGASGYGKTSIAQHFASQIGLKLTIVDSPTIVDTIDWFGKMGANNGTTFFEENAFTEAILTGKCIILLDEINRIQAWVTNTLLPLLDHRRNVTVNNKNYQVANSIAFMFSVNRGWEYAGTNEMDLALKNRIHGSIKVGALPVEVEEYLLFDRYQIKPIESKIIVKTMHKIRNGIKDGLANASTRTSLNIALWVANGLNIIQAFEVAMLNEANEDEVKTILEAVNNTMIEFDYA